MSRIGNRVLAIPEGVSVALEDGVITVKGSKGELSRKVSSDINVEVKDNKVVVSRTNEDKATRSLHGTINALINNMIIGVNEGYSKSLEIVGVGYRFNVQGKKIVISAGYSHPVEMVTPEGLEVKANGNNEITITGIDKELVGEFAAKVRDVRKPEPYKGKGIRYVGEYVRRKEGKSAK